MDTYILSQIIAFIGYSLYVGSSFLKSRVRLLALEAFSCFVISLHWFLLDIPVVGMMNLIYVYMNVIGIAIVRFPQAKKALALSFPLLLGMMIASWSDKSFEVIAILATMFALTATTLSILSKYCINMIKLRILSLASSVLWVLCGVFAGSFVQIFACAGFSIGHFYNLRLQMKLKSPKH